MFRRVSGSHEIVWVSWVKCCEYIETCFITHDMPNFLNVLYSLERGVYSVMLDVVAYRCEVGQVA